MRTKSLYVNFTLSVSVLFLHFFVNAQCARTKGKWIATIETNSNPYERCGGALVSPEFVLTSAQCHVNLDSKITVGHSGGKVVTPGVREVYSHPEFNPNIMAHDLALVRLQSVIMDIESADIRDKLDTFKDVDKMGGVYGIKNETAYNNRRKIEYFDTFYYSDSAKCTSHLNLKRVDEESAFCTTTNWLSLASCELKRGCPLVDYDTGLILGVSSITSSTCGFGPFYKPNVISSTAKNWSWIKQTICSNSDYRILPDYCRNTYLGEVMMKSGGSPEDLPLCIQPQFLGTDAEVKLRSCDSSEQKQRFTVDPFGQLHTKMVPTLCLSRLKASKVALSECAFNVSDTPRNFVYDEFSSTLQLAKGGYWATVTTQNYKAPTDGLKLRYKPIKEGLDNGSQNIELLSAHETNFGEVRSESPSSAPTSTPTISNAPSFSSAPTFVPSSSPTKEKSNCRVCF